MDNVRLFLWLTLLATVWLAYNAWVTDYASVPAPPAPAPTADQTAPAPDGADTLPPIGAVPSDAPPQAPQADAAEAARAPTDVVHVQTDVLDVLIDLRGGDLVQADLLQYPVDKHNPDTVVRLLQPTGDERWVFQTGLRSTVAGPEPNHRATFRSASTEYRLAPGQDELVVTLDWVGDGTVSAHKTYTFKRGLYSVDLALNVAPPPGGSWRGAAYAQMVRVHHPVERSYFSVDSYSFRGPALYDGDEFEKLQFDDIAQMPVMQTVANGWFAAIQHHFLAAGVPPRDREFAYTAGTRGQEFVLSAVGPIEDVSSVAPLDYHFELFVGPKLQEQLAAVAPELDLTVDYGKLTLLSKPLFALLSFVERWVDNWGWAIVIVTIMIKLAFYKLTAVSGRSMAKMRKLAPRMKALQERYKDDRQALSQAMMDLYRREKVNPAMGCVPVLIQAPFFFAFYWVLIESVEMRQAPFMLWIDDLSSRDPYFVLPLLMGVAMFFQTRMNPAPPDPVQARVMQIMPIVFTGFFLLFPAGLVLYWLTNTALSILQQWRINKIVAGEQPAT